LYIGIITGCLNVGSKNLFSETNNLRECSLHNDTYFSDCYGFTENELNSILSFFSISDTCKDKIRRKYDGYSCDSDSDIIKNLYNPFSIMNFIAKSKNKVKEQYEYESYWVNSGSNNLLKDIVKINTFYVEKDFISLLNNNVIKVVLGRTLNLKNYYFKNNLSKREIWSIILFSGYLTIVDKNEYEHDTNQKSKLLEESELTEDDEYFEYDIKNEDNEDNEDDKKFLKIPNKEVFKDFMEIFRVTFEATLKPGYDKFLNNFITGIYGKNIKTINENLNKYLLQFSPYHLCVQKNTKKDVYQVLLMQIFIFMKVKNLTTEENSRYGRYDIGFPSIKEKKEYILIEIKTYKNKYNDLKDKDKIQNYLHKECVDAINQIEGKKYEQKYKDKGYTGFVKYGMAFYKNNCRIEMKINNGEIESLSDDNNNNSNNSDDDINDDDNNNKNKKVIKTTRRRGRGRKTTK